MSGDNHTINLSGWPSVPDVHQMSEIMIFVSETLGSRWSAVRRGVEYVFTDPNGEIIRVSKRDFRVAIQEATKLTVIK